MTYTQAALLAVAAVVVLDLVVLRTALLRRKAFWAAYAIVLFFQLIVNGLLTGLDVVRYDPDRIVGLRIVFAPVEDLLFGFAMVSATLCLWVWAGRRAVQRPRAERRRAATDRPAADSPTTARRRRPTTTRPDRTS